jgi:hypothetical protein
MDLPILKHSTLITVLLRPPPPRQTQEVNQKESTAKKLNKHIREVNMRNIQKFLIRCHMKL